MVLTTRACFCVQLNTRPTGRSVEKFIPASRCPKAFSCHLPKTSEVCRLLSTFRSLGLTASRLQRPSRGCQWEIQDFGRSVVARGRHRYPLITCCYAPFRSIAAGDPRVTQGQWVIQGSRRKAVSGRNWEVVEGSGGKTADPGIGLRQQHVVAAERQAP